MTCGAEVRIEALEQALQASQLPLEEVTPLFAALLSLSVRSARPPAHCGRALTLLAQCIVFPVGSHRNPQRVVEG